MGPRAPLALAGFVAVALAGCDGASNGFGGGDLGMGGAHDMSAGGTDLASSCVLVQVSAIDPSTGAITDHAPARLIAVAQVAGGTGAQWTLTRAGDATSVTPMATDSTGLRVQYDVSDAGTWTFKVKLNGGLCDGEASINLANPIGAVALYRFRLLPPETSGFPLTETTVSVTGGMPLKQDLTLDPGTAVNGLLRAGGVGIAGEVRLIADDGPDAVALAGPSGSFSLAVRASGDYTSLLIPSSVTLAPHLGAKAKGATFVGASFVVPGGVAVAGTVVDSAAAPLDKANVVLRAGALPSGPGLTNAGGAFTLYAEPGSYTLSFGAPGWPEGTVDNVVVPAGGGSVAVAYTIGRVTVGGSVVGDDGTTPVAGARVTITSQPLAGVADVSIGGGPAIHAGGRVARVVLSLPDGSLPAMQLPPGTYELIVEPPGPSLDGLTTFTQVVGGATTWTLALAKPVPLAVTVTRRSDGKAVEGALLTAIETIGLGAAPTGVTAADGSYGFVLDKGAPLVLVVDPPSSEKLAGTRIPLGANAGSVAVTLGPGLPITGTVRSPSGTAERGVRVEALCYSCGSTTPVASAISDGSGVYRLYLPDPGNVVVDGGAGD